MAQVKLFHALAWRHFAAAELLYNHVDDSARTDLANEVIYIGGYGAECLLKALL